MFNQNMLCFSQDRGSSFMERWQSRTLSKGWRYMRTKTIRDTRRQEIITAARDLFSRQGFHGTSIPDIAHAAGISTGLIYYIFSSKEDILLACSEEVATLHLDLFHQAGDIANPLDRFDFIVRELYTSLDRGSKMVILMYR